MHLIVSSLFFYYLLFCFVLVFFIVKAIFFNLVRGINLIARLLCESQTCLLCAGFKVTRLEYYQKER